VSEVDVIDAQMPVRINMSLHSLISSLFMYIRLKITRSRPASAVSLAELQSGAVKAVSVHCQAVWGQEEVDLGEGKFVRVAAYWTKGLISQPKHDTKGE